MKVNLLVIILLTITTCYGQEFTEIKGKVIDRESKAILPYANIYIKDRSIGTISNQEGEFSFKIPDAARNDTLIISYLGYENYKRIISQINDMVFYLTPSPIGLNEIIVSDLTAEGIVKKAIASIEINYPVEPYISKAFYRDWKVRESTTPDSSRASLIEAAISIYDKGFGNVKKRSGTEEVFLDEVRRNRTAGSIYNYLNLLLEQNFVRHIQSKNIGNIYPPFDFKHLVNYRIGEVVSQESGNAFKINADLPGGLGAYELYIDTESFAIVRINFKGQMQNNFVLGVDSAFTLQKTHHLIFVDNTLIFRRYGNRYFLSYLKLNWKTRTRSDITGELTDRREFYQELLVNDIVTENVKLRKDELKYPMSRASLETQVRPYNEAFWKNFNTVKERPLDMRLLKLLENSESIENQFVTQRADSIAIKKQKPKKAGQKN